DHLGFHAEPRTTAEQAIVRVALEPVRRYLGTLAIGCRRHDQPLHRLQAKGLPNELLRQPCEQLRMACRFALNTKVFTGLDDSTTEHLSPKSIHGYPTH